MSTPTAAGDETGQTGQFEETDPAADGALVGDVKVRTGVTILLPLEVQNIDVTVTLSGTLTTHDWEQLFDLYEVPHDAHVRAWLTRYREHPDKDLLDRNFDRFQLARFPFEFTVTVRAAGRPLKLRLGFNALRLDPPAGDPKGFTVTNAANVVAYTEEGKVYEDIVVEPA
ncbi:hypothetical protein [Saccharothrix australiensis]|uniref:Uncharacterized protein n=1 Tax=Saccharothrix australiensis TaxID=2072 RepID=A0A495W024_9PSEU|nr:hypothetical protein [Saccharothrix australiensis]RKT54734.1 hypothetical protein C8E97_3382 [Saccharothrix australiensis]